MMLFNLENVSVHIVGGVLEVRSAIGGDTAHIDAVACEYLLSGDSEYAGRLLVKADPVAALNLFVGMADALADMQELPEQHVSAENQVKLARVVDLMSGLEEL